mmetsp:Transcript_9716/g.21616  ORF Transcript_9716/g.21616 Transcript_9716/m.21616 type:complete len:117 (-) Transcript_9716:709-1059(-)
MPNPFTIPFISLTLSLDQSVSPSHDSSPQPSIDPSTSSSTTPPETSLLPRLVDCDPFVATNIASQLTIDRILMLNVLSPSIAPSTAYSDRQSNVLSGSPSSALSASPRCVHNDSPF